MPTVNTNILIDRVLIGLSAALGSGTGLLFAISLAPEMGLLGLTAGQTLSRSWPGRRVAVAAGGVGAAITAAGALGWALSRTDQAVSTAILGLGASVIVYLVLEELLREVHETDTGPLDRGCGAVRRRSSVSSSPASPPEAEPVIAATE